jgi:LuxR family transcriptional regulator, maltose regulon positive regulatory protein
LGQDHPAPPGLERHAGPWAWLTVDPADNDPARFVRYLGAALGTVSPSAGTAAEQLLEAAGITPAVFVQHLIPELDAQTDDCVLVLDDFHVLDQPSVLDGCRLLVEHLPPRLHLVLGTREDPPLPLARLRARGC